ncbi:hypothetical protein FGD77_02655 [Roseovarius sp. M141]|nr:hypothetical protein [Roseovarius sp. M141]
MIAMLERLRDEVLHDIGIARGDIRRVVEGFDSRELRMTPVANARAERNADNEVYRQAA